jgi:hypothetical protein
VNNTEASLASKASDERLDRVGMTASILCALHCAAGAAIAAAVPALRVIESERLERLFVIVSVTLATVALRRGVRLHNERRVYVALAAGALVLLASRTIEFSSERTELLLSIAGASLLVTAHVLNIRALRRCCARCNAS